MPTFSWTTDAREAESEQSTLREMLKLEPLDLEEDSECLAIGVSYNDAEHAAYAVAVRSNIHGAVVAGGHEVARAEVDFPYVPGLYAYREGPAVCRLLDQFENHPHLLIFDSQGVAHPRGFGLASHIGVLYDLPTIGLTRHNLFGEYAEPPNEALTSLPIVHGKRTLGYVFRLTATCKPVFASPGHRVDLSSLQQWIRQLNEQKHCFPTALNEAHALANRVAKQHGV